MAHLETDILAIIYCHVNMFAQLSLPKTRCVKWLQFNDKKKLFNRKMVTEKAH